MKQDIILFICNCYICQQVKVSQIASCRFITTATYTGGIVLLDAVHMPTGCGTWPSFWSNGANGEIDIVEGVNDYANNQATAHTSHGCTLPSTSSAALNITGTVVDGTNCAAAETGNVGCGMTATQSNTFGVGFNNIGGGVYASTCHSILFSVCANVRD